MRMLDIFSSEKTYLHVIPDANNVASLLEQILHYMVQKGKLAVHCLMVLIGIRLLCNESKFKLFSNLLVLIYLDFSLI